MPGEKEKSNDGPDKSPDEAGIGIIGGSGLYEIEGLENTSEIEIETPFGKPSDALIAGTLGGRRVHFLPRHGRHHGILPHELNHRANIYALRSVGVRWIIAVTAVGSLQQRYAPRDILLPDQFFDRTSRREEHTFFGNGLAVHVAFGDPISTPLRQILDECAREEAGLTIHNGGTYVNMDGPAFSTRAESETNRQLGFDVIGMTNLAEAKLAREAEIALATMALVTDYDCWKTDEDPVTAAEVVETMAANSAAAKRIVARAIPRIPTTANTDAHHALDSAILTPKDHWPPESVEKLRPILGRLL